MEQERWGQVLLAKGVQKSATQAKCEKNGVRPADQLIGHIIAVLEEP